MSGAASGRPPVNVDLRAAQSPAYRGRGVARWATEVTRALLGRHRDLIGAIRFDASLPPPADAGDLLESGLGTTAGPEAGICHVMGPFDSGDSVERMWPRQRPPQRLVVTVYDLIPELMPETYLSDPGVRARYRARRHLVRSADAVVTLSRTSAGDIAERLGVDPRRVHVAGASCSVVFRPPASREQAVSEARRAVPGLGRRWVAYNGAVEPRKNVESLLEAYARLPRPVREGCDLVLACAMDELQRHHYQVRSAALGVAGHVRLTGFVEDAVLARIYQGAEVVVCPSLYEGYGLPVAEALSCGAPVLASGNSAMAELVAPGATFDPTSLDAITGSLTRALSDESWRDELRRWAGRPQPTWDGVAGRVADVYGSLLRSKADERRRAPKVALVTPWPPQRTGVADYSARLVAALDGKAEVDVFVDGDEPGDERLPGTGSPLGPRYLPAADRLGGGYDAVLVSLGNSEFHAGALRLLRGRSVPDPVVLAHDVNLTGLYRHGVSRGSVPEGFAAALDTMYPHLEGSLQDGWVPPETAERLGVVMARDAISCTRRFLATSEHAAARARLDAYPGDSWRVGVWPYAYPEVVHRDPAGEEEGLVVAFGLVNAAKRPGAVIEAVSLLARERPGVRLVFAGPIALEERQRVAAVAAAAGAGEIVTFTGYVDEAAYRGWLARAAVAVQLRARSNGETSGAVADCMTHGIATVVSDVGPQRELPPAVAKVPRDAGPETIAAAIAALLDDVVLRRRRGLAAQAWAGERGFDRAARYLLELTGA